MKKLLIIQQDEAYFLFETLRVLEKHNSAFKDFDVTILTSEKSLKDVSYHTWKPNGIVTDPKKLATKEFDVSVNLSLTDASWEIHGNVKSLKKVGAYLNESQIVVHDLWSSFLLTLKTKAPFLTFHLQDIYKNILGIRGLSKSDCTYQHIKKIAFGMTATHLFSATEQEAFINEIVTSYPGISIVDITEVDLISDVSDTLYIGPATLRAAQFCEADGRGFFVSSHFQGLNLLPYNEGHLFVSSRGQQLEAKHLFPVLESYLRGETSKASSPYSLYELDHENMFGAYLKSLNESDDNYPFYQSHVVLWNFLLNLFDTNLEVTKCNPSQLSLLKTNKEVLEKFLRLHDYAMVSVDTIYHESKSTEAQGDKIAGHLKNLQEIDQITEQIAQSHSLLRPILDFYRIRKGQNFGETLHDQSQNSFLTYTEEHQALEALDELFSVTLRKNEVNI